MNIGEIFMEEIARELMLEINPNLTQEKFEQVWSLCDSNPWNAGIIYRRQLMVDVSQS